MLVKTANYVLGRRMKSRECMGASSSSHAIMA